MVRLLERGGSAWLRSLSAVLLLSSAAASTACGDDDDNDDGSADDSGDAGDQGDDGDGGDGVAMCDEDNGSIALPDGFCASVFADQLGTARHIAVSPSGDVFVAVAEGDGSPGSVVALRDDDGDGVADQRESFGDTGGNGIAWRDGQLFFAQDDRILRYELPDGQLVPEGEPAVVVSGLPADGDHVNKTVVVNDDGQLMVNIGSASNSCQEQNRVANSLGQDPCPELDIRAGIWTFPADGTDLVQADGERFAEGLRNMVALAIEPQTGQLFGVQNGRDQLFDNWPTLFQEEDETTLPAEELFLIDGSAPYGWPYCYFDPFLNETVLAPEYGGDGQTVDLCADMAPPDYVFPAHWAPLGMTFYTGDQFPDRYQGGAFIAFHGSRFEPDATGDLPGYNVVFLPFDGGLPVNGNFEVFADDFAGDARPLPDAAEHRPVGVAQGPDGELYISDDYGGRIWRVIYTGE